MTCGKYWESLLAELRLVNWDNGNSGADYCSHTDSQGATVAQQLKARGVCCGQHKTMCEVVTPKAPAAAPVVTPKAPPAGLLASAAATLGEPAYTWKFYPKTDCGYVDVSPVPACAVRGDYTDIRPRTAHFVKLEACCLATPTCAGFNTGGALKTSGCEAKLSTKLDEVDLYVKHSAPRPLPPVVTPKAPAATPAAAQPAAGGVCDSREVLTHCKLRCHAKAADNAQECSGCTAGKVGAGGCFPGALGYDGLATQKSTSPLPRVMKKFAKLVAETRAATTKATQPKKAAGSGVGLQTSLPCCANCHEVESGKVEYGFCSSNP
jgi:hypothetical protein